MRKILKALSLVMVLVMCFTMVFTTAVSAEGATPTLTINSAAVKEGETVTITVDAANFGAVAGAHFVVALPAELENVAVAESDYVYYNAEAGTVTFVKEANWTDGKCDGIADGALVTITATAAVGTYVVDFAETGKTVDFCDANYATIDVTKVAGEVVVENAHTCAFGDLQYKVENGNCITYKVCECGAEEIVATVANYDIKEAAVVSDGLALKFRVKTADKSEYSSFKATFTKDVYNKNALSGTDVTNLDSYVENATYTSFLYTGIASYEMTSNIHVQVYGIDANEQKILISEYDYCFVDYLATLYSNKQFKTFVADIANYGAYAQIFSEYNTDNLANADTPAGLASELPTSFENTETTASGVAITPSVVLGNSVKYRYRIKKADVSAYSNLKLKVTYIDAYNVQQTAEYTTFDTYTSKGVEYWQVEFDKLIAAQINVPLTVVLCDGDTEIGAATYGFEAYAQAQLKSYGSQTSGFGYNLLMLCKAVVAYGRTAATLY